MISKISIYINIVILSTQHTDLFNICVCNAQSIGINYNDYKQRYGVAKLLVLETQIERRLYKLKKHYEGNNGFYRSSSCRSRKVRLVTLYQPDSGERNQYKVTVYDIYQTNILL